MYERYRDQGCASEFPVRTKCIALFQTIDGVDVLLFAMYVYEYGDLCPAPNKRRVYISYLDSVQYFEPQCYRTNVYHTIMVEYLRYVKNRGFHTAHIWSCPPTPGDDYIFYSHPKHQLVPREDILRAWYHRMLDQAKSQGVVVRTTTLFDEYFGDDTVDLVPPQRKHPFCLPYFEGKCFGSVEIVGG
jgi:E1A/CREB-binding protein